MEFNHQLSLGSFGGTIELLQRVCIVIVVAYFSMRLTPVRRALNEAHTAWKNQVAAAAFFGLLAILGTHLGLIYDTRDSSLFSTDWLTRWATLTTSTLPPTHAIISLRDLMVLAAGIFGGVWVGLGAGLVAGFERHFLHGNLGDVSGLATVVLGLGAGLFRYLWPKWTTSIRGILIITALGTVIQKLMLVLSPYFFGVPAIDVAIITRLEATLLMLVTNCLGCLPFLFMMKDMKRYKTKMENDKIKMDNYKTKIENDKIKMENDKIKMENDAIEIREKNAELRALHAQVEPHFLNSSLSVIQALMVENDPFIAFDYVSKLSWFFNKTRVSASANSITLADELENLRLYLDFQSLRFPEKFSYHEDIPPSLMQYDIAPRSLQTLVENIFLHARQGKSGKIKIEIKGEDLNESMQLKVIDTGCGMTPERVAELGRGPVKSSSINGGGSALYQISRSLALAFNDKASIKIESQLGLGTTVTLNFPKRSEAWQAQQVKNTGELSL